MRKSVDQVPILRGLGGKTGLPEWLTYLLGRSTLGAKSKGNVSSRGGS